MLQFDWEEVNGATITAVLAAGCRADSEGGLMCDRIALVVGARAVVMHVNIDTDEVIVSLEDSAITRDANWQTLDQLAGIVSRSLGWCWIGRNYLGYLDTFTFSIDGIDPAYSFTGIASRLDCARVTRIAA